MAPTPTDTPSPSPSLPADLVGEWETNLLDFHETVCLECGPEATLIIRDIGRYTITRAGGGASGDVSVDGERLVFGPNPGCSTIARYEWQGDGESLTLTAVGNDPCARRAEALDGPTYTRVE